jgi:thioesterase domain-containing protein/acyl carrier protein
LDDQNRLVPRGEKGELCIAGPAVSGGYLNQPEKTSQVFIKNPYSNETGYETLYKSGDLASISENGDIKIWGRVDFQIKIRGYRIEPGAIDTYVLQYPGITEAVTVAADGAAGIKRLVTYIAAEKKIESKTLRDFIAGFLPPYMVPQGIEQIDKLPRNTNGKIDRSKLPEPTYTENKDYTPTETETEKKLARLWALSLGVEAEKIGLYDDFFELGGDSLRAVLLSLEISKAFGADVSPAELFKARSLKQQAAILAISRGFNPLYRYSAGADKTPLFFAHGANIGAEAYAPLAQKLPPNQPFYCFENHNIFNFGSRIKGITHLAETYTKYLKEMAPHGPYILGGWSFGGLVSFEMAVQLEKNGDVVEHLYLLDPTLIRTEEEKKLRGKLREISNYREYLKHDPLFERFRNMGLLDRLVENDNEIAKDMEQYVPTAAYRGEATLFKAVKPDPVNPDSPLEVLDIKRRLEFLTLQRRDNGFGGYIRNLRIIEILEIHDGFMRGEALDTIAAVIGGHTPQHPAI